MIGFNSLGKLGRLGNQMFQYAALKGIAANRGYSICIPKTEKLNEWEDHQIDHPFRLSTLNELNYQFIDDKRPTVVESGFAFDETLFNQCPDWVNLHGFFQSEKYFKHIREELIKDFSFDETIYNPSREQILQFKNPIALHIRRTDYVTNPNHTVLPLEYYQQALELFDDESDVILFSDDHEWISKELMFNPERFKMSYGGNNFIDLCLMTLCSGHIIANSSFSWWGAWLSNSEKVVAPSGWFKGSQNEHLDTSDLIPESWIVI